MAAQGSGGNVPEKKACKVAGKCSYSIWKQTFEIDEKYVPIKGIGKGAYGVVCSARNRDSGEKVAIKKISCVFNNEVRSAFQPKLFSTLNQCLNLSPLVELVPGRLMRFAPSER